MCDTSPFIYFDENRCYFVFYFSTKWLILTLSHSVSCQFELFCLLSPVTTRSRAVSCRLFDEDQPRHRPIQHNCCWRKATWLIRLTSTDVFFTLKLSRSVFHSHVTALHRLWCHWHISVFVCNCNRSVVVFHSKRDWGMQKSWCIQQYMGHSVFSLSTFDVERILLSVCLSVCVYCSPELLVLFVGLTIIIIIIIYWAPNIIISQRYALK